MDSPSIYLLAADALLLLHLAVVLFIVAGLVLILVGGLRGWSWVRNRRLRIVHLAAIGVVIAQAWAGRLCPLTVWEQALRQRAGAATYPGSFIAHWLETLLYYQAPMWVFALVYSAFGALVVMAWYRVRPR